MRHMTVAFGLPSFNEAAASNAAEITRASAPPSWVTSCFNEAAASNAAEIAKGAAPRHGVVATASMRPRQVMPRRSSFGDMVTRRYVVCFNEAAASNAAEIVWFAKCLPHQGGSFNEAAASNAAEMNYQLHQGRVRIQLQ